MNPVLAVLIAAWPIWFGLAVCYVTYRVESHRDLTWEDANQRPGNLSEGRDR